MEAGGNEREDMAVPAKQRAAERGLARKKGSLQRSEHLHFYRLQA